MDIAVYDAEEVKDYICYFSMIEKKKIPIGIPKAIYFIFHVSRLLKKNGYKISNFLGDTQKYPYFAKMATKWYDTGDFEDGR